LRVLDVRLRLLSWLWNCTMNVYQDRLIVSRRFVTDCRAHADEVRACLDTATMDQSAAAARDSEAWLHRVAVLLPLIEPIRCGGITGPIQGDRWSPEGVEAVSRLLATVWEFRSCIHLRRTPAQPALAALPLRRVDCRRCAGTKRNPPADEDDRCDWCGARGVVDFTPIIVQYGPLLAAGDACDACAPAFTSLPP